MIIVQTVKSLPAMEETVGSIPGLGRSPGEWNGGPLQYSCLQSFMDRGASGATVHGVTKSWTQWATNTFTLITWMANWKTHFKSQVLECLRVPEQGESPWPIVCPVPWGTSHTYVWTPRLLIPSLSTCPKKPLLSTLSCWNSSTPTGGPSGGLDQERDSCRSWRQIEGRLTGRVLECPGLGLSCDRSAG